MLSQGFLTLPNLRSGGVFSPPKQKGRRTPDRSLDSPLGDGDN